MSRKSIIASIATVAVAGVAAAVLFVPHTVKVEEYMDGNLKGYKAQTTEVRTNLFNSVRNPITVKPRSIDHAVFTGMTTGNKQSSNMKIGTVWKNETVSLDYKPVMYTASFKEDGHETYAVSFTYGENVDVPKSAFLSDKHPYETFKEWKKEDSKVAETGKDDLSVSYDAVYEGKTYKISYDLDGGTAENPATYQYGKGVASFANASKNGYTFDGWFADTAKTKAVTSLDKNAHGDQKLYAKFHQNPAPVVQQASSYRRSYNGGNSYSGNSGAAPSGGLRGTYGNVTLSNGYSVALEADTQDNINRSYVAGYRSINGIEIIEDHNYGAPAALPATQSSSTLTINGRTYHKIREWEAPGMTYTVHDPNWNPPYGQVFHGVDSLGQSWSQPIDSSYVPTIFDGIYMPSIGGKVAFKTCSSGGGNSHWTIWG